ncbi:MAG: NAD(P)-dependent oxidoreductase [Saprospiraceae bacterium]|nr:NAD(P)-dependent oxidoreductase [Saprospiraceae bacterium]
MKIAITGANGYIGSALALYLLKQDVEVIAISRTFNTGVKNALKNAEFINADVLSKEFLNLNLACDAMIHLASANDIMSKDFDQGVNLSLFGTKFALELCKKIILEIFYFFLLHKY